MQYFPLFMDLTGRRVLVVGGGEVATRKVEALVRAGAMVTLVAPELSETLLRLVSDGSCKWIAEAYRSEHMGDYVQVWATTDDNALNHLVHKDAKASGILVNVVDDKPYCDFITPSMINRGRIQVAISSGGASPVLVRNIREQLEMALPQSLAMLAEFGELKRDKIKQIFPTVSERRMFWERFLARVEQSGVDTLEMLEQLFVQETEHDVPVTLSQSWLEFGSDVEMLSIKALRLMQKAELVLYPDECPFDFIDLCRRDAERQSYQSIDDLEAKLSQAQGQGFYSICIFIEKCVGEHSSELLKLIGEDKLLKVVA